MPNLLRDPLTLFVVILSAAFIGNFILVSREAAVQVSLRRSGVRVEAEIIGRRVRWTRGSPSYLVAYEFIEFATEKKYRRSETVYRPHYDQWAVGDSVSITVLPHNPRISRLVDDHFRSRVIFGTGAITLVFPIYLFGLQSIGAIFVLCSVVFAVNWLWINLRKP